MTDLKKAAQQALEALENSSPDQYPEDAGVFYDAKDALRAALAKPVQEPDLRELLIGAAAMAVAAERKGAYQGASWVADAVLEQPKQPEQEPVGDSYADLFNALQRIETAAVFLPSFKITHEGGLEAVVQNIVDAIAALEQPEQEPVAWFNGKPVYSAPPRCPNCASLEAQNTELDRKLAALEQPEQEPLSDEELDRLWREPMSADWEHREYARAVEAAHGIKENT
jgi:hypothetical protein